MTQLAHTLLAHAPIGTYLPPEGGTLAAILALPDGRTYGLIVSAAKHERTGVWGEYGQDVPGARGIHGLASTNAMAEAGSEIARVVRAMVLDGHADWYIPSRLELLAAYEGAPELFDKDDWYWSSTQSSRCSAWCQDFEYGLSRAYLEDYEFRARPVRSIQLQPFTPSALAGEGPAPIGEADPRAIFSPAVAA